ncbi:hypothetical protein SUGI_0209870 [Cryptomeria japonica]|nr:hypothetical protein SUGI_0209870 [Cryptomeria japonica]
MRIVYANYHLNFFWHLHIGYDGSLQEFAGDRAVLNGRERTSPEAAAERQSRVLDGFHICSQVDSFLQVNSVEPRYPTKLFSSHVTSSLSEQRNELKE